MSGAEIVGELLRADEALTALVPIERIKGGSLPDGVPLPALLVRTVSVIERQPLKHQAVTRTVERVSITVRAATWREQRAVIKHARRCCRGRTGTFAGCQRVSVLGAGTGPDLRGPGGSFEQAHDTRVSFDAAD